MRLQWVASVPSPPPPESRRFAPRLVERPERDCPDCAIELDVVTVDGAELDRCERCGGLWVKEGDLDAIFARRELAAWRPYELPPRPDPGDRPTRRRNRSSQLKLVDGGHVH